MTFFRNADSVRVVSSSSVCGQNQANKYISCIFEANFFIKYWCYKLIRKNAKPLLRSLHWLPVKQRVTYKMATLTFKVLSSSTPTYLHDLIQPAVPVRPLRSSDAPLLSAARTRTELARRAFSVAAPHTWNSLPSDIRSCHTFHTFKNTSKHTCADSHNLKPPAPPYPLQDYKALYKCCTIIIIIILHAVFASFVVGLMRSRTQLLLASCATLLSNHLQPLKLVPCGFFFLSSFFFP